MDWPLQEPCIKCESMKQIFFMSADVSLCGVHVCVHIRTNNISSKSIRPKYKLFLLKHTFCVEDKNCLRNADLFVRLFPRTSTSEVPPPKV